MSDLIEKLQREASAFDFFQVVRLLVEARSDSGSAREAFTTGRVRFAADRSIAFPSSDVAGLDKKGESVRLLLSFLGLLGVSSPLPNYFLEHAARHSDTEDALCDFLEIFNNRLYALFYLAWSKYRPVRSIEDRKVLERMAALAGVGGHETAGGLRLAVYAGLFAQPARSAKGLQVLLAHHLGGVRVRVQEWVTRRAVIREKTGLGSGAELGYNAFAGDTVADLSGKFRVLLGPLERERYEEFLPGKPRLNEIRELISRYIAEPLEFDVVPLLAGAEYTVVRLGDSRATLGRTAVLGRRNEETGKTAA